MYKYLGGGFIAGIPAKDMTDEEARPYKNNPGFKKLYKKVIEKKPINKEEHKEHTHGYQGTP